MNNNVPTEENRSIPGIDLKTLEENVPDKLHPILEFLVNNLKPISFAMGALLLVVGIFAGVQAWNQHKAEQEQNALGEIVVRQSGAEKIAALEGFAKTASGGAEIQALFELASTQMESGEYAKAAETFARLEGLVGPNMKPTAALGGIKAVMLTGDYAQAVTRLQALKAQVPEHYKAVIAQFTAISAEKAGNWPVALGAYTELASMTDEANGQYLQAKIKELQAKI